MANVLTGDYEAALQIAVRQINGLLGTLHQNGAVPGAALMTPHSTTGRIGDPRRRPPDVSVFEDWVVEFQRASPGGGLRDIQSELIAAAPPGAARMLTDAFAALRATFPNRHPPPFPPPDVVRGMVKLQTSSPTITVSAGSSSEITVHANIRAQYYPDPGTTDLPAPIHGEVHAAFEVRRTQTGSGTRLLISPSPQDAKIQFTAAPGSGLSAGQANALAVQVRKVLREQMVLLPVDLPPGFPFAVFKGLGSGASQAIALPFQLSGAQAPASGVQPLTQSFIGASGFALAVRSDYVSGLIDLEAIRRAVDSRTITLTLRGPFGVGSVSVTYRLRFTTGPTLTFKSGGIEIAGRVAVETSTWWAPNGFVSFKQMISLMLDTRQQTVTPVRAGDPSVDQSWFIPHDRAVEIVRSQVDSALSTNAASVRRVFDDAGSAFGNALSTFDPSALVSFTGVEITPDGVIVRGDIHSVARRAPVVHVAETHQSTAFTAFDSWMPAGRIDRFIWSWVEHPHFTPWGGIEKSSTEEHRFIFPKPAGATQLGQICLRIQGMQRFLSGEEINVDAGTTCHVQEPEVELDLPSWWGPVMLPIWRAGLSDATPLRDAIAAHVGVAVNVPGKEPLARNVLVYFADGRSERPLDALTAALSRMRNSSALTVIVVLPAGAFDASRREVESKIGSHGEHQALVQFTEDHEGGWTRVFGVGKTPSAYVINARREFVWKQEAELNPAELADALDRQRAATSPPRFRPLRLAISPGEAAPDVFFDTDRRDRFALHRFRGREVLLNFWQSWSAPCLAELARLQRLQESGRETPLIVAFHGGNNSDALDDVRRRLRLSFALVQDSQQQIARQYGVRCWPTTILLGADGRAQHIQFGTGHEQPRVAQQSEPVVRP